MIRDYLRGTRSVYEDQIAALTAEGAPGAGEVTGDGASDAQSHAPLDGVTAGRLEFTKGAAKVTLRGDGTLTELYRATFEGPAPEITVVGGTVTVQQRRRFRPFDWRNQSAEFALSAAVPWDVSLRGGMWKLVADFRELRLTRLEVTGGASDIEIFLPQPVGVVPVRISGGASEVMVHRPRGRRLAPRSAAAPARSSSTASGSAPSADAPCCRPGGSPTPRTATRSGSPAAPATSR